LYSIVKLVISLRTLSWQLREIARDLARLLASGTLYAPQEITQRCLGRGSALCHLQ
jgi:hypothetical protein